VQPAAGSQPSAVQGLLSLQSSGAPPAHAPEAQVAPEMQWVVAQAVPSGSGEWVQAPATSASVVQGF
jgi:hypothetical protein